MAAVRQAIPHRCGESVLTTRVTRLIVGVVVAVLTLVPVIGESVPVTQDGPSHAYNAAIAVAARAGASPYRELFVARDDVRPNVASHATLSALGPRAGWSAAERGVLVLALLGGLAAAMLLARTNMLSLALAGWLASNWFVWMGFYDFALSIPFFFVLVWVLSLPPTTRVRLVLQMVLALLYLTHVFTFAAGVALVTLVFAMRAMAGERFGARELLPAVPGILVLLLELATGVGGGAAPAWTTGPWARLSGFAMSDFIVTVLWLDSAVGVAFLLAIAAVLMAAVSATRSDRSSSPGASPFIWFGATMLILSLVAPDAIGEGGYVPARMRLLGAAALLPALGHQCARLSMRWQLIAATLLATVLTWRSVLLAQESRTMRDVTMEVSSLLDRGGVREGEWMVTRLSAYRRWPFRVGAYRHLGERSAVSRRLVVLNNYEALYGIFSVSWRSRPDWVFFRPIDAVLAATLVPGDIEWSGPIHVLHERNVQVVAADSALHVVSSHVGGRFAVTSMRKRR